MQQLHLSWVFLCVWIMNTIIDSLTKTCCTEIRKWCVHLDWSLDWSGPAMSRPARNKVLLFFKENVTARWFWLYMCIWSMSCAETLNLMQRQRLRKSWVFLWQGVWFHVTAGMWTHLSSLCVSVCEGKNKNFQKTLTDDLQFKARTTTLTSSHQEVQ